MEPKLNTIEIRQLDRHGKVFRTFTQQVYDWDLELVLDRIQRAYNMDHTLVLVNGITKF